MLSDFHLRKNLAALLAFKGRFLLKGTTPSSGEDSDEWAWLASKIEQRQGAKERRRKERAKGKDEGLLFFKFQKPERDYSVKLKDSRLKTDKRKQFFPMMCG